MLNHHKLSCFLRLFFKLLNPHWFMPRLYLLGGENIYKRDALEVNQAAFQDAGQTPSVLVFSWARASFDYAYLRRKTVYDYFLSLGASEVTFADYSDKKADLAEKIGQYSLVYLTGGVPTVLIERLRKTGVGDLLAKFQGVIVGRSAGALALCRNCLITCRRNKTVKVIDGIALTDLTLKAHYKPENDPSLIAFSMQQKVYAIPKSSAIIYTNGNLGYIGRVFLFEDGAKRRLN
jgi:dipeptidase E